MRIFMFLFFNFYFGFALGQHISPGIDPPGTIQLTETLFIDKTPVTNLMFLEYLTMKNYLRSQGYHSWKTYYTDKKETKWSPKLNLNYPTLLTGLETKKSRLTRGGCFRNLRYMKTPVLRISKALAEDFCQWRTEMVEYAWNFFPKYVDQKEFADKIQYRLPFPEELEEAQKYFSEKDQLVRIKKKNPLRYKSPETSEEFLKYNISEFTLSDSLYGENWKDVVPAKFPNDLTGFRCVCEVRE